MDKRYSLTMNRKEAIFLSMSLTATVKFINGDVDGFAELVNTLGDAVNAGMIASSDLKTLDSNTALLIKELMKDGGW